MLIPQQIALYSMPDQATTQRYNVATISWDASVSQISQMKAWNPNIKLYYYRNFMNGNGNAIYGTGSGAGQSDIVYFRAQGWLLHDSTGKEISPVSISTEKLIDPANVGYRTWIANYLKEMFSRGYDGVQSDNMPAPTYPATWTIAVRPINPRKSGSYTDLDWYTDSLALVQVVRVLGIPVVGNGIPQGDGAYGYSTNKARCDNIIANTDGVMIEGPVGWSHADLVSRGESAWLQNVTFAKAVIDAGKICWWSNGGAADMENDSDARYAYCTYMLNAPNSKYSIKFRGSAYMAGTFWTGLVSKDLGSSLGAYFKDATSGDYIKEFSGGTIRINPTTKTSSVINGGSVMGTVNIIGNVSAQAASGEAVTIKITKPDATVVTLTANTLADKSFSASYTDIAGNYSLVASILYDSLYTAASSPIINFSLSLTPRTITVSVQ